MSIIDFAHGLDCPLTVGHRAILRVAIDGAEPGELPADERAVALKVFGGVERFPAEARKVLVLVIGARAGKSSRFASLIALYKAFEVDLSTMAAGEKAVSLIVAPDMEAAQQTLSFVSGLVHELPHLKTAETTTTVTLVRPDGHEVKIQARPASAKGRATRSRSFTCGILEECGFFEDEGYSVSDVEVFRSISARLLPGGLMVLPSTPWAELGLLWDEYDRNFGHPVNAMCAQAHTLDILDTERNRQAYEIELSRDPANAEREFGAKFMSRGVAQFFDAHTVDAAIDPTLELPGTVLVPSEYAVQAFGGDFAFERDSAACVGVQRDTQRYSVSSVDEITPQGQALVPSETVGAFARVLHQFGATQLMADQHYRQSIIEHLRDNDLYFLAAPEGMVGKAETYVFFRALLNEGLVRLPKHPKLIRQLKDVRARPKPGGGLSIEAPRSKTGGHGDIVSALVLAAWAASKLRVVERPKPLSAAEQQEAHRESRMRERTRRQRRRESDRERQWMEANE